MCGIAGYWDKSRRSSAPIGSTILDMLRALDCRGPDSAGDALFPTPADGGLVLQVKLGEDGRPSDRVEEIIRSVAAPAVPNNVTTTGSYLRMTVEGSVNPQGLATAIEAVAADVEVVSMGCSLEIVKQVGSPDRLEETFEVARTRGSHGIGHTRLSTESKVDLSHSQPFWAHGDPDLAIVHNGHITNYHRMRRLYEQSGVRFYTENDSEIIAVYVAEGLGKGLQVPIFVKLGASRVYDDVKLAAKAGADVVVVDGMEGGTGASPAILQEHTGVPTLAAVCEARAALEDMGLFGKMQLIIAGGIRDGVDAAKAMALGADAIYIGTLLSKLAERSGDGC